MTTKPLIEDTPKLIELLNSALSPSIEEIRKTEQIIMELTKTHFDRFCLKLLDDIIIPEAGVSK